MMRDLGDAMRGAAVIEALGAAEDRWFRHEARHHAIYLLAHAAAIGLAVYVLLTAPPAAGFHGRRLALELDWWLR